MVCKHGNLSRKCELCDLITELAAKDARIAEMQAELKAGARLVATVGDKNRELENRIALMEKALKKIADYDWVKGGRIIFGNADFPGDAGQFYRGYNAGIKGQFEATKAIAEAALRALSAKEKLERELADEKQKVKNLEEYMLKGVAFRDELQAEIKRLEDNEDAFADIQMALAAEHERLREIYRTGLILREGTNCGEWLSNWRNFTDAVDMAKAEYTQEAELRRRADAGREGA